MKDKCGNEHALMLMKSIAYILNETWINRKIKAKEFIETQYQK